MKTVLVQTKTCETLVTRLDVDVSLESAGLDTLDFENRIDNRMYLNADEFWRSNILLKKLRLLRHILRLNESVFRATMPMRITHR